MFAKEKYNQKQLYPALDLEECYAKTYRDEDGIPCLGRTVYDHCELVARVARSLIARMPYWLQTAFFPAGSELIAGAHDVGKISPTFQEKIRRGLGYAYEHNSLSELAEINPELESQWGYHGGVSQACIEGLAIGEYIPEIVGQHHGYSPNLGTKNHSASVFGGTTWQERRVEMLILLKTNLHIEWPKIMNETQARVLSGLTTVSDWIGSSGPFEKPGVASLESIEAALDKAGFISPKIKIGLDFEDIFKFKPHAAQVQFAKETQEPGVYILEAPMGLGKTEAALFATYLLMSVQKASGFYFALPTQLTSNKIYDRVENFLEKILEEGSFHKKAQLLHGSAWLKDTEMGEEGNPGGSWFQAKKRGILAPFAVGTIDQALMAVMNVKHGFVRTFGLAGKVVILDEVHSYDLYTGTILDKLIKALRELHCTVIVLSATLSLKRREQLLGQTPRENGYPLISCSNKRITLKEVKVSAAHSRKIQLKTSESEEAAIEETLKRAEQGQQVLWIENTVDEAQALYKRIGSRAQELNIECGLLHSRYLRIDREKNEEYWVSLFGKNSGSLRQKQGRVLVGTQVLEQSLDIDADFLVTRIAPTDMLLQRLGRLWRHQLILRAVSAKPEAWILCPSPESISEEGTYSFGVSEKVYSLYILYRTLEVWRNLKEISLPDQIRDLIEETYADRNETDYLAKCKSNLEREKEKLQTQALSSLSQGGKTLPEAKASTRYSEQINVDVLLISDMADSDKRQGKTITFLNGEKLDLPSNGVFVDKVEWREKAIKLRKNMLQVPEHKAPERMALKSIQWLKDYAYLGDATKDEAILRIARVSPDGSIKGIDFGCIQSEYELCYDSALGYQAKKVAKN